MLFLYLIFVTYVSSCDVDAGKYIHNYLSLRSNISVPDDVDVYCLHANVHGPQTKKVSGRCSASFPFTTGSGISESRYRFNRIPIFAPCQVIVSDAHKFLYVRQPKSASTAVTNAIKDTFCGTPAHCSHEEFRVTDSHSVPDDLWQNYFVFTVVRNPWTRSASAFTMMNTHFLYNRDNGLQCKVPFHKFVKDVAHMKDACWSRNCCPYIPGTGWVPWFLDQHLNDQVGCIFSANGESMVDFIGRSETIAQDWIDIVAHINRVTGTNVTASAITNPNGRNNLIEHACHSPAPRLYKGMVGALAKQYAADVLMLGYLSQQ